MIGKLTIYTQKNNCLIWVRHHNNNQFNQNILTQLGSIMGARTKEIHYGFSHHNAYHWIFPTKKHLETTRQVPHKA
jgi:hypothetical protein